jgi:hypothetical protein
VLLIVVVPALALLGGCHGGSYYGSYGWYGGASSSCEPGYGYSVIYAGHGHGYGYGFCHSHGRGR